jgi:hypothetical protein
MGSTVILLLPSKLGRLSRLAAEQAVKVGQKVGILNQRQAH